jgi:tripartite-type tricarboxylate transporter receptor subunit TctC
MKTKKTILRVVAFMLAFALVTSLTDAGQAADKPAASPEAAFYKGKVLVVIVPYSPGGGYDAYARMIAPYLEKNTGSTVVVQNVPGGGTLVGALQMYRAKPDGLTMSIVQLSALVARTLLGDTLGFDLSKFNWLARVASENRLIVAGGKSGFKNIEDMKKSSRTLKFSAAGVLSSDFNHIALSAEALGLNIKMITAFEGSNEQDLAVIRGDVDATLGSYTSKLKFIKTGDMVPIIQFAAVRHKEMPNIPLGTELPNLSPNGKALLAFCNQQAIFDRVFAAPPGIPPARLKFLRDAVMRSLTNPELMAIGEKQRRPLDPVDAAAVTQAVKNDLQMPVQTKELIKQSIYKYKG